MPPFYYYDCFFFKYERNTALDCDASSVSEALTSSEVYENEKKKAAFDWDSEANGHCLVGKIGHIQIQFQE